MFSPHNTYMYILVWTATDRRNAQSQVYSKLTEAWEKFGSLTYNEFPHYIMILNTENHVVTVLNWSQFINHYDNYIEELNP